MRSAPYGAFEIDEYKTRFARARAVLAENDLSACLMMAPEHLFYFGGYDSWVAVNSPQALIFTPGTDEPTLILRDVDLSLARESAWVGDIRTYSLVADDFPALARSILREKGVDGGSVGIETQSYAVPAALGTAISSAIHPLDVIDTTYLLGRLRLIKSPAELAYMEQAAKYVNAGLQVLAKSIRPGITEIALAAEVEATVRRAGSDYPAIPTELSSGDRSAGGHATPRARLIEDGDIVHAEFAGVAARYHVTGLQTLSCGEPSSRAKELYDLALESLRAGIAACRVGVPVADVEEASLEPLRAQGLEHAAMMRFGYGIGIAYPPIWLETLQIARGFDDRLASGMAFVLHSCIELPDENLGVIQGGTYVLGKDDLYMLAGAGDCALDIRSLL